MSPEHMAKMRAARKGVKTVDDKKKVAWRPAQPLDTIAGLDKSRFTYRWVDKDAANMVKKQAEGWEICSAMKGDKAGHPTPDPILDGQPMTPSISDYRELILMRMPKELAAARNEYYADVTDGTEDALKRNVEDRARKLGGSIEGSIKLPDRVIE